MNIQDIIDSIKSQLQPVMEKWKEAQLQRVADYREVRQRPEYKALKCEWTRSKYLTDRGWSKFYAVNYMNGKVWWDDFLNKEIKNKMLKVDVAVHKKLKSLEVLSVKELMAFASSKDGFIEGIWELETPTGSKRFQIETIYAGGYNVQCFHIRTLYKLSK